MIEVKENKEFKDHKVINGGNMKQGWEIKKLGEVATILNGYAFDSNLFSEDSNDMPLIRIRDIKRGYTGTFYKGEYSDNYIIRKGDYLIGMDGEFNIAEWKGSDALLNQRVCKIIANKIKDKYLLWYLPIVLKQIEDATPFVTVKHLSSKQLLNANIPIPPLPEQEKIVAELDCLSGVIEKKKLQLKELDALAESIFYTMFGDPITNEKGWEVKKWNDILAIINGKNQKAVENPNGKFPIYGSGGIMGYADEFLCPQNTVIIGRKGNINKPLFVNEPFWNVDTAFGLVANKKDIIAKYLFFYCQIFDFNQLNKAVTIPSLTKSDLLELKMPCPPLTLQQEFATKIDAIEKQKGLIKESIKETETLFNARMQYYFG